MTRAGVRRASVPVLALAVAACASCVPDNDTSRESGADGGQPATSRERPERMGSPDIAMRLVDVTRLSGIEFRHVTGGYGAKLLPETLGAGVAFLDLDGDGYQDLFFVNSSFWPGHEPAGEPMPTCALYRGRGDGTFQDATTASGAGISLYGMGCAVADYDGDGLDDIYVTALGDNVLLRNVGGRLEDATAGAGVAGGAWTDHSGAVHPEWSTGAAWADFDLDGDLDLFVANYVEWTPEGEIFTTLDGHTKVFTTPDRYRGLPCRLFVNRGDGTFEDGTARAGISKLKGKALGLALWDFDGSGYLDVVVANDTRPNFLFFTRAGLRLEERGLQAGIAYDATGRARAGMGIDIADYSRDGVGGVAIGNFTGEPMSLYRWSGDSGFVPSETSAGLGEATFRPLAFGMAFLDLDLDGIEDLVVVNGHIEPEIARFESGQTHAQSAQIFQGAGDGTFRDVSGEVGPDFARPRVGRGLAAGDVDGDGDLDLVITTNGGRPALLRNDLAPSRERHFLRVRLRGKGKNTGALGARVRLSAGGATQTRVARTGSSYLSQSEATLTFGLGAARAVDRLEVRWPGGETRTFPVTEVDATLEIEETP